MPISAARSRKLKPGIRRADIGLGQVDQSLGGLTHGSESTPGCRLSGLSTTTRRAFEAIPHKNGDDVMYYQVIGQCTQALKNLEVWLDKAEQHAAAKKFDVGVLLTSRLAPDMKDFIYQVQSACDYAKGAAAWLSGQKAPRHEDNEQTIDEVRARIRKTVDFTESVSAAQYAGASDRKVSLSFGHGKLIGGEDYLLQVTVPNVYFHVVIAYAVLRHNGVDIGKMDFLGPINWIDA
jgi:hypothetical protein